MRPDTAATDIIPTMTGTVGSRAPYQQVTLTVHLLKTQGWPPAINGSLQLIPHWGGGGYPDATTFGNYTILNCYLVNLTKSPSTVRMPALLRQFPAT